MKRIVISTALAGLLALGVVSPAEAVGGCVKGAHTPGHGVQCDPRPGRVVPRPAGAEPCDDDSYAQPPYAVWVHKGDTLWSIAVRYLGNGHRYREIMARNGLKSTTIYVNQILSVKPLPFGCGHGRTR